MSNSVDDILAKISSKIKENNQFVPDFFDDEKLDESPLMFLTSDMIVSNTRGNLVGGESLNLEKQAKIITYDVYEKLDLDCNLHDLYEAILESLKNINK